MTETFQIPVVPVTQLAQHHSSSHRRRLLERLGHLFSDVVLRDAPAQDAARWHEHEIGGRSYRFARPLTLTPYASARACSARCRFCSETLRDGTASGTMAASMRPSHRYADSLREALKALEGVPPERRDIVLRTAPGPDSNVELSVIDSGPGVDEAIVDRLFSPFVTTKPAGAGLGLAISRSIVEAHKGTLRYRPAGAGGACFVLRLPHAQGGA